jgi:non-ribosomal peptide synthetase component E (peptide arylation enzyme)
VRRVSGALAPARFLRPSDAVDRQDDAYSPKEVHFVDNLPLTPAGKIDKKPLRAKAWSGSDRMVH